jgi:hypothetical protein
MLAFAKFDPFFSFNKSIVIIEDYLINYVHLFYLIT